MTPSEKAKELIEKFEDYVMIDYRHDESPLYHLQKECAKIAVDEIINQWEYINTYLADLRGELNPNLKYWYEVKQELEK